VNNKNFTKIMAIILAALMVLGAIGITIGSIWTVGALEIDDTAEAADIVTVTNEAEDVSSSASSLSDKIVRVGLFFRNSSYDLLRMNHSFSSETGLRFFMTDENGNEIVSFSSPVKSVSVVREADVAKNEKGVYESVKNKDNADIHTFALRVTDSFPNEISIKKEIAYATSKNGFDPFYPIFEKGNMYVGMGDYSTSEEALERYIKLSGVYKKEFALKSASDTYITVIDNDTGKIILRANTSMYGLKIEPNYKKEQSNDADDGADIIDSIVPSLSIEAIDIKIEEPVIEYDTLPYLKTAVGNIYAGTFEYKATSDGLTLTNILKLDDYVKSVVPFEIYNDWPREAIKAFSIVSRTYALSSFHSGADFDMCSETHCQAYLGRGRSTEYSDSCIDETSGMILTYNGEPAKTFYHAISGGSTESAANVWGGSTGKYPYLVSVDTPEEKYGSYKNGLWSTAVTMSQLSEYILGKEAYADKFTSSITDLKILETTPAGYVYSVLLTDADGNKVEVKTTDKVRILLSKFVKSANFIMTRGIPMIKANSLLSTLPTDKAYPVLTANGEGTISASDSLYAVSSDLTPGRIANNGSLQFIGKGYGHGVGLSQYGTHDMAEMGYDYKKILSIYFPGTVISTYE